MFTDAAGRMLRNDITRKKGITAAFFIFVLLAAIAGIFGVPNDYGTDEFHPIFILGVENTTLCANACRRTQSGQSEQHGLKKMPWSSSIRLWKWSTLTALICFWAESEKNSVMDIDFVTQNQGFDYLLNLDSEIIQVNDGEIAVPVYYMQQKKLRVGDQVRIDNGSFAVHLPSLILSVMLR